MDPSLVHLAFCCTTHGAFARRRLPICTSATETVCSGMKVGNNARRACETTITPFGTLWADYAVLGVRSAFQAEVHVGGTASADDILGLAEPTPRCFRTKMRCTQRDVEDFFHGISRQLLVVNSKDTQRATGIRTPISGTSSLIRHEKRHRPGAMEQSTFEPSHHEHHIFIGILQTT